MSQGFQDPKGNPVAGGSLMLTLSQSCTVTATGGVVDTQPIYLTLDNNGKITNTAIWFSDELSPSGTVYRGVVYGKNGCSIIPGLDQLSYSFTGAGPFDLSTALQSASASPSYSPQVLLNPSAAQSITGFQLNVPSLGKTGSSNTLSLPGSTDTLVGRATTDTLTGKTYDTAGSGNVLKINGTQVSAVTGTGSAVLATSPTIASLTDTGTSSVKRVRSNQGSSVVSGDFSISGSWGSTASISSVGGTDTAGTISIASAGTGQGANPTFTLTFHDGAFPSVPIIMATRGDVQTTGHIAVTTVGTSAVTFTVNHTPSAGQTYVFYWVAIAR